MQFYDMHFLYEMLISTKGWFILLGFYIWIGLLVSAALWGDSLKLKILMAIIFIIPTLIVRNYWPWVPNFLVMKIVDIMTFGVYRTFLHPS